ncbi:MAG TPA: DUF502 domain-containing protein [Verrucomicrobiae bacterium]|jgi:uncharacterized membrane protein|nr:DUF502 domain-containing protein [Verrucomicrobiae bacterium]
MFDENNKLLARWRADFFAGLAIVGPGVISVGVVVWLFGSVAKVTNILLFFLPSAWTHEKMPNGQLGGFYWYWSCVALCLTIFLIGLIGRYGRNYFGRKAIQWADQGLMRVPLVNKIYGTVKQVNASFSSNKSSFKQVALVTFPHARSHSVAFVTGEQTIAGHEKLISVFIPTTPNPTSGFLLLLPESEITVLDMSVAEGIKFIISLGAISPEQAEQALTALPRS